VGSSCALFLVFDFGREQGNCPRQVADQCCDLKPVGRSGFPERLSSVRVRHWLRVRDLLLGRARLVSLL